MEFNNWYFHSNLGHLGAGEYNARGSDGYCKLVQV